jgi:cell division protein FtsX
MQRRSKDAQRLPDTRVNLPDILVVAFAPGTAPSMVEAAVNAASKLPRVESVQADLGWYRRLATLVDAGAHALVPAVVSGGLLLLAILFGAVRFTAVLEPGELRVLDQIGADPDFMRRPAMYAGAVTLGLAAAVSLGLAGVLQLSAGRTVAELGREFGLELSLVFPPWPLVLAFVAACVLVGAVSANYFAGRTMRLAV